MRIALYLKHFPPSGAPLIGGTSGAVDGLAGGLAANGVDATVLCEGRERRTVRTPAGYAIECFPTDAPYRSFGIARELSRYAERELVPRHAVCLVNGMFHPGACAMGRMLSRLAVPYVAVPHDPYDRAVFRRNAHLKWPYWYLFERALLKRASAVQVFDARHAACLRGLGVDTPVIETSNGVRPEAAPAESRLVWRAGTAPARLLFLGRIDAYNKGLDILLDAFALVSAHADVRLTLQGPDWGDRTRLARRASAWGIAGKVEFRAPDYGRASPEIIGEHDIICLPSRFEGFGLAALEGMLAGRVLLVSERAGIERHVRSSGAGIAARPTVPAVAQALFNLLTRRADWRAMGMSGRRYALARLQWKDVAADALRHYSRLAR